METKITNEEIRLLNALYWWQMTGKWPCVNNKIFSSSTLRPDPLPKKKHNPQ
ncbi:MAG: hypothetical protein NTY34_06425 [Candidatus Omnitrophica bacterium]|nr:hypothetical protein [Candidatus Omnitrophota bacterium]